MSSENPSAVPAAGKTAPSARDRILDAAGPLFYREGFRAIGVDRVIAEAGVAKATFYKHFPAKDDLIVAWLDRAEGYGLAALPPDDGPEPMTAYAEVMIATAEQDRCLGCTFQGTAAEFSDPGHPAHAAALKVKRRVLAELERRAGLQGLAEPRAAAERVFLLLEGVWASVRMFGREAPLGEAREAVRRLVG
jgi:AcrR family transcriptional regulator